MAALQSDGQNRVTLAIKLWRLGGASEQDFLLSWFFVEKGDVMTIWPGAQGQFLESLKTAPDAPTRRLVAALLADGRIENYDIETLRPLAELLNTWLKREEFDIQRLWQKNGGTQEKLAVHQLLLRARQTQKFWLPAKR